VTVLGFLVAFSAFFSTDQSAMAIMCIFMIIFLAGMISLGIALIIYQPTAFAVTNRRVIAKTGLIRHRTLELLLTKVESIDVSQPIMGRILNYGTITFVGTGGTRESVHNIFGPMEIRKRIDAQIEGMHN